MVTQKRNVCTLNIIELEEYSPLLSFIAAKYCKIFIYVNIWRFHRQNLTKHLPWRDSGNTASLKVYNIFVSYVSFIYFLYKKVKSPLLASREMHFSTHHNSSRAPSPSPCHFLHFIFCLVSSLQLGKLTHNSQKLIQTSVGVN